MENNEQLTQNPALEEGGENATTTKAPKKAIDGNEKKKIVKLIQPSILPAKVRIEVATLVAETIAETAPVADEVMPEMVDVVEPDEEELVEDNARNSCKTPMSKTSRTRLRLSVSISIS